MIHNKMRVIAIGAGIFLAVAVAVSGAASDDAKKGPGEASPTAAKQATPPAAASQGVRVFIDPVTGKIREPEPEEIQQLTPAAPASAQRTAAQAAERRAAAQAPLSGPDGAVGMKLDDSYMVYSVATRNPDGTISFECVTGPAKASQALAGKSGERRQSDVK
jgi:hypothetical protein